MKTNPLKWHGGKSYLASRIIALMPPHIHYVEPYFGGGAVLFRKPAEGYSEVVNDLHTHLAGFWKVLSCPLLFEEFQRRCQGMALVEDRWKESRKPAEHPSQVDCAVDFFIRYRQSRQGLGTSFATLSRNRTRRGMNEQASSWLSAVESLPEAHERLRRVVVLNQDALAVIRSQDGPNTLFYLDPPYLQETRVSPTAYEHEMTTTQHATLLRRLTSITGKFILSGYRSNLYDTVAETHNWHRVDIQIDNKASSRKTKETKTECLWMNYTP